MVKKHKNQRAIKSTTKASKVIKVGKLRNKDVTAKVQQVQIPQIGSVVQKTSDAFDKELWNIAERQMIRSRSKSTKGVIALAPPTFVLPTTEKPQSFEAIDQLLETEAPQSVSNRKQAKNIKKSSVINRFEGLSDSEDDKVVAPFSIAPPTFIFNSAGSNGSKSIS